MSDQSKIYAGIQRLVRVIRSSLRVSSSDRWRAEQYPIPLMPEEFDDGWWHKWEELRGFYLLAENKPIPCPRDNRLRALLDEHPDVESFESVPAWLGHVILEVNNVQRLLDGSEGTQHRTRMQHLRTLFEELLNSPFFDGYTLSFPTKVTVHRNMHLFPIDSQLLDDLLAAAERLLDSAQDEPSGVAADAEAKLDKTAQAAADYIRQNPGHTGTAIAHHLGILPDSFRRLFKQKLKPLGFYNQGDGYQPPHSAT